MDIILTNDDHEELVKLKKKLAQEFKIEDPRNLRYQEKIFM